MITNKTKGSGLGIPILAVVFWILVVAVAAAYVN